VAIVAQASLRDSFARAGYTQDSLARALCVDEPVGAAAAVANASRLAASPLGTLVRLFLAHEAVPRAAVVGALDVEAAVALGLLEGDHELSAPFALDEWQGRYLVHDHPSQVELDHVTGISNATRTLAALTPRRPVRRALDLGTGCGSQALLVARHAEHVVATDITERALRVARMNLELNDTTNIELRQGSLFEPVAGERFDLIVANPPFVVSPDTDVVFRDAGLEGDEISRLVAQGAAEHLEPGGHAAMLICWTHRAEDGWPERVRGWLEGTGCDAWLVRYATEDPLEYALKWTGEEAAARWTAYYETAAIGALTTGGLVLRKRTAAGGALRLGASDAASGPSSSASDQIERVLAALRFRGDLREERLCLAPHVLDEQLTWVDGAYRHVRLAVRLNEGAGVEVAVDPPALPALFALDGSKRVCDLPGAAAALPTIRRLFEAGLVGRVPVGDPGFEPGTSALSERRSNQLS
jgi:methylase of polypeptide subunit release factors